jgi:hypothetical protein
MSCNMEHHKECGCPMCAGAMGHKKKLLVAMVFFGLMAIFNVMIAGFIHLILHAIEVKKEE